jgi:hypothetical protein
LSQEGEKAYIQMVLDSAKDMWGGTKVDKFRDHIERTAKAVYTLSNYPLEPVIEPITKMSYREEDL